MQILDHAIEEVRARYLGEKDYNNFKYGLKDADVPLWAIYALQEIGEILPEIDIYKKYGEHIRKTIECALNLNFDFLNLDKSGLIYAKIEGRPLTWMDGIVRGIPVTWRPGFIVEENALWYNTLRYYSELCKKNGNNEDAKKYSDIATHVKENFERVFWNEKGGYLYDYVDGDYRDDSIRPNQIIASSLRYSPLDTDKQKKIVDVVKRELLTPRGLRTLSPKSPNYEGVLEGNQAQRDIAAHQGSVFPWITAFFAEAYLKLHKQGGVAAIKKILDEFEEEMNNHCLGTVSECYNGNPPHNGKGAVSMAWNVAGIVKVIKLIEKYS
jgi:predicted glycogen debranching enzyme